MAAIEEGGRSEWKKEHLRSNMGSAKEVGSESERKPQCNIPDRSERDGPATPSTVSSRLRLELRPTSEAAGEAIRVATRGFGAALASTFMALFDAAFFAAFGASAIAFAFPFPFPFPLLFSSSGGGVSSRQR